MVIFGQGCSFPLITHNIIVPQLMILTDSNNECALSRVATPISECISHYSKSYIKYVTRLV